MSVAAPARRLWTPRLVATLALFVISATFFSVIVGYALVGQADDRQSLERRAALLGAIEDIRGSGADFSALDARHIKGIERTAGLKDLRFETEPVAGDREVQSVLSRNGRIIGWFSWEPDRSMSNALSQLRPLLGLTGVFLIGFTGIALWLVRRAVGDLGKSEQLAWTLAYEDMLTGLHNHRKMIELIDGALVGRAQGEMLTLAFLDLDGLKDKTSPVPAALPTAEQFAARMVQIGVNDGDRVVIYDGSAVKTSARAWFIFRMYGVRDVGILDGGLGKWRAEDRAIETGERAVKTGSFSATTGLGSVRTKADVLANIVSEAEQVLDARGVGRFTGEEPEIRPGMPSGHIPGARNLPFGRVLKPDGTLRDEAGLRAAFAEAGIDLDKPVITTCGSGVTASVLLFAMHLLGKDDTALYDGSWSEWAIDPDTPKATGPAA